MSFRNTTHISPPIHPASTGAKSYVVVKKRNRSFTIWRNRSHRSEASNSSMAIPKPPLSNLFPFVNCRYYPMHHHEFVEPPSIAIVSKRGSLSRKCRRTILNFTERIKSYIEDSRTGGDGCLNCYGAV